MDCDCEPYDYQGLEQKYKDLAIKELHEDPQKVRSHIVSLRLWLRSSQHIKNCPEDDRFLLKFLRAAKFNHENAQARLDNYCTLRGSETRGCPSFFEFPSVEEERLRDFLGLGVIVPCGYNDRGEIVMISCMKGWDPSKMSYAELIPYFYMGFEVMVADERAQIAGISGLFDLEHATKKQFDSMMASQKVMKDEMKIWQEGMPVRNRDFFYYREPMILDMLFAIMEFWMKEKIKRRIHRIKNDLSKVHEKMPGSRRILPKEYGGENGTFAELVERWKVQFYDFWSKPYPLKDVKIDESLRPKESLKFLKEYADCPDEIFGKKGTYTKIDSF